MSEANKIFFRIGDAGDYKKAFDLDDLAKSLIKERVKGPIWYHNNFGIGCKEYQGNNYISVYYGTNVETPVRGLDDLERNELNRLLEN